MIDFTDENIEVVKVRIAECDACTRLFDDVRSCKQIIENNHAIPTTCTYKQVCAKSNWRETGTAILIKEKV